MKTSYRITVLFIFVVTCSCSVKQGAMSDVSVDAVSATRTENATQAQLANLPSDLYSNGITKLIKTANYRFQVENVQKTVDALEVAIRKYQAYISSSDMRLDNPFLENKMTIRVQNDFFQDLLKEIDKQALYVNFRDIKTEDVSKQFVDLESRLKTKREVEERYMEILRKKAGTIEQLLNAEKQIGELHEEIEATISRINFLKDEVRYSTITLEFYQTISTKVAHVDVTATPGTEMKKALAAGWNGVIVLVTGLLYLWPVILIGMGATLWVLMKRKYAGNKA